MLQFTPVIQEDIPLIKELQPEGWPDITEAFQKYISWEFCFPVKVLDHGKMIGLGAYIIFEKTGWLAHIIVNKDHRNKGIGYQIVEYLMEKLTEQSVETMLLIATKLGEPVYKRAQFRVISDYIWLKSDKPWKDHSVSKNIIPYNEKYLQDLLALDFRISGERREWLIIEHLDKALIYVEDDTLSGVYLPHLGEGAIYADNGRAGCELMKVKYTNSDKAVIPNQSFEAVEFLLTNGFIHDGIKGKRMIHGNDIDWKPQGFFSRISGNFG